MGRARSSMSPDVYMQLIDNIAGYAVFIVDRDGIIADWNEPSRQVYGYGVEEIVGKPLSRLCPPDQIDMEDLIFQRVLAGERIQEMEAVRIRKDGQRIDVLVSMTPVRDAKGRVIGAFKVVRDVTERKRFVEALRDREARLHAIVDTAVEAIITINDRGIIESANPATYKLFGYEEPSLIGQNVSVLTPQPHRSQHDRYMQNYLLTGIRRIIGIGRDVTGQRREGTIFPIHLSVSEIQLGATRMFTGIIHDLTRQRALESQILEASTNEQRRIGQDLHDGLCQELVALGFNAQTIAETLRRKDLPEAKAAVRLGAAIRDITAQARQLSHGLNPIDVKAGGLTSALKHLAGRVSETFRVRCTFQQQKQSTVTNDLVGTHLYRIAQEAISNAIRHGRADRVDIRLTRKADYLVLSIRDNGIGLKPARADAEAKGATKPGADSGIGLQTMAYRARVIGGELRIEPHAKAGTVVTCHLHVGHSTAGNGPP